MNIITKLRRQRWIFLGRRKIKKSIQSSKITKVILGAGYETPVPEGWIATDIPHFDITKESDWDFFFSEEKIDHLLAEHVLEHITEQDVAKVLNLAHKYLKKGGTFRIAVPDGWNKDPDYIKRVKPPADGHLSYWNLKSLKDILEKRHFEVKEIEYCNEQGELTLTEFNFNNGIILRSKAKGFKSKYVENYNSLIVDALKK